MVGLRRFSPLFLLVACVGDNPPEVGGETGGDEMTTSQLTSTTAPTSTSVSSTTQTTVEPTSDDSGSGSEDGPQTGSGESTGTPGCQMEMDGADVVAFVSSERMPTLAETHQFTRTIGRAGEHANVAAPPDPPGGPGFIPPPDAPVAVECSVWDQDCPPGEKCMPWANDGGNAWNATRCSPVDPDPDQVGDECTVEGSGVSGVDSCDIAQMCWNVDTETNMGTCVAFCSGSEAMPTCAPPGTACSISNEGVLILCLPLCNPLVPEDCPAGEGCYPSGDVFQCAPDASGDMGAAGDPCEYLNACDTGLMCADPASVPNCGSIGCCSPFCEVGDDTPCLAGQTCVPFYEMGQAPDMCLENVGICTAQ